MYLCSTYDMKEEICWYNVHVKLELNYFLLRIFFASQYKICFYNEYIVDISLSNTLYKETLIMALSYRDSVQSF